MQGDHPLEPRRGSVAIVQFVDDVRAVAESPCLVENDWLVTEIDLVPIDIEPGTVADTVVRILYDDVDRRALLDQAPRQAEGDVVCDLVFGKIATCIVTDRARIGASVSGYNVEYGAIERIRFDVDTLVVWAE